MKGPSPLELPNTINPIKPTRTITMGIIHHIRSFQSSWANSRNVSMIPFIAGVYFHKLSSSPSD